MLKDEIDPKHTTLYLTESANQVLFRGRRVSMPDRTEPVDAPPEPQRLRQRREEAPETDGVFLSELKAIRNAPAQKENIPAHVVFSNATAGHGGKAAPFLEVSGVGEQGLPIRNDIPGGHRRI